MTTPEFILRLREKIGHDSLFLIGVTCIVLREHEGSTQVLLVRRADNLAWTPVGGIVEPGQQVDEAAVREVLEETTIQAEVERLVWVKTYPDEVVYDNGDRTEHVCLTMRMHPVSGEPRPGDDESVEARWWDVDQLPEIPEDFLERITWALADKPGVRLGL